MDTSKMNHLLIQFNNHSFRITAPVFNWILVCIFFSVVFIVLGNIVKKSDPSKVPSKTVVVIETIATTIINILKSNLGKHAIKFVPIFGTILVVMIASNLLGLIGLQSPTSNIGVNLVLGVMYFVIIQFTALKTSGVKGRIKGLLQPFPFLLPLNILGELALPLSLSIRLFGNILSGSIIMLLIYTLMSYLGVFGLLGYAVTPVLHIYFDVFSGFVQGYVFMMLGSFFLGEQLEK